MATYYSSYDDKGYRLKLVVTEQNVDTTNNTSKVHYVASIERKGNYTFSTSNNKIQVKINGTEVVNKKVSVNITSSTSVQLASGTTGAITHNSDGSKTVACSATFTPSSSAYYMPTKKTASGNFKLTNIARASVPTISPNPFIIGDTITINTNRKSSSFTHTVTLYFGNYSYQIATGVTDRVTFNTSTIKNEMYQQIPNAKEGVGNVTVTTYNGSTNIGSNSVLFNAKISDDADDVQPTFTLAYQDTNATTLAITNNNQQLIQNLSTLQLNITDATAKLYATLDHVTVTILGVTTTHTISGSTLNINVGVVNASSDTRAEVVLYDSRGVTKTKSVNLKMLAWELPTAIINLQRQNNFYSETDLTVNASYSSLDNKNVITIKARYKKTTEGSYGSYVTLQDNVETTLTLDNNYEWDIQVLVQDLLGSTTYNLFLGRGLPIIYFDRLRSSTGINCFPQNDDSFEVNGENILNRILGYGMIAKQVVGDWNDVCGTESGFYMGNGLTNSPTGQTVAGWWWVIHIAHNNLYQRQIAYSFLDETIIYTRIMNNGVWSSWENNQSYYAGDVESATDNDYVYTGGGFLTGSSKSIRFTIPLNKPTKSTRADVSVVLTVRQGGNYLVGSGSSGVSYNLTDQIVSPSGVGCQVDLSSAPSGATNNDAIGIALDSYTITFK